MAIQQIDRYIIKSELGRGGMATVYLAHDPRFGRDVALKLLPHYANDAISRGRFQREARTIAGLEHRAIVPVYDFGEDNEMLFLVMRLMSGGSLADRIHQGPISLQETGEILQRIASALDYAHRQGIVHRDLKPGNILFDQNNAAYLADFGIAKLLEAQTTFTGSAIVGTPAYISPEQVTSSRVIDGRADVYSLGAILFEMLTGQMPYRAETPMQVYMKHALDPPPRLLEANAHLPSYLQVVIDKAMAKSPDDRFNTAGAMVEALLNPAKAAAIQPVPPTAKYPPPAPPIIPSPSQPKPARGRTGWLLTGLLMILLLGGTAVTAYLYGTGALFRPTPAATSSMASQVPLTNGATLPALVAVTETEDLGAAAPTSESITTPTLAPTFTPAPTETATYTPTPSRTPTRTPIPRPTATPTPRPPTATPSRTATATIVIPSTAGLIYNFEASNVSWRRGNQPYGELIRSNEQVRNGSWAGKLSYDFPAVSDNYVVFLAQPTLIIGGEPTGIRAWIYGDNAGHFLNLWVIDADNEVRQYTFGRINFTGWRQITAWFDEEAEWPNGHISGPDDGQLKFPVRLYAIVFDSTDGQASKGEIYLDDLSGTADAIP